MNITCRSQLIEAIPQVLDDFNTIRPQRSLNGYTPNEAYDKVTLDYSAFTVDFASKKAMRAQENRNNGCKICLKS